MKKSGRVTGASYGTIEVISQYDGQVYIDNEYSGEVSSGMAKEFFPVRVGQVPVKVVGRSDTDTQQAFVRQKKIVHLIFRAASLKKDVAESSTVRGQVKNQAVVEDYDRAVELYAQGRYRDALDAFRQARATIKRCGNSIGGEYPSGLM